MTEKFCQDCPCSDFNEGWYDNEGQCKLGPPQYCGEDDNQHSFWGFPGINKDSWCFSGRQIMAETESWERAKASLRPPTVTVRKESP